MITKTEIHEYFKRILNHIGFDHFLKLKIVFFKLNEYWTIRDSYMKIIHPI